MKEQLRIAMLGHKRVPSREGGIEIVVEELCTRMIQNGDKVVCYNRSGHHVSGSQYDTNQKTEYKGIRLKTVPTIEKEDWQQSLPLFLQHYFLLLENMMWYISMQKDLPFFPGFQN